MLARVALDRGEPAEAARWCGEAEAELEHYPDAGILRERLARTREGLERLVLVRPLTPAEARLLPLLATHLTLAEMALKLSVSVSTVKSHVTHVFEKLDVGTRSDAVKRARAAGLLPGD